MNTLPSRVHDSQNGLNYTLVENYYLPDLEIESGQPIGKFGRARMKYLKEYRPGLYSRLLLSGKLYDDLNEVDAEAQRLLDQMIPQMAAEAGINEDLKAADPIRWGGRSRKSSVTMSYSSKGKENSVLKPNQARILHLVSKRILVFRFSMKHLCASVQRFSFDQYAKHFIGAVFNKLRTKNAES